MPRYTATITTPRTPEEAFEYLADFSSVAEWDPSVEEARRLDPSHAGKGARFEVVTPGPATEPSSPMTQTWP